MRIGHGYDAHTFTAGRPLILGGVNIPHSHGLAAHSDGDAVIHALCDAFLGAAALGDIGRYFPDTDQAYSNIDSRILLRHVVELLRERNFSITNFDITILAQSPRMAPHLAAMKTNLSEDTQVQPECINIKATTTEGMGFVGRHEGIAVHAVTILE